VKLLSNWLHLLLLRQKITRYLVVAVAVRLNHPGEYLVVAVAAPFNHPGEYLVVAVAAHFNQVKLQHLHPPQQENEKQSLSSSTTLSRVVFSLAGKLRCMDMPHTIAS